VADFTERELIDRIAGRLPPPPAWMPIGIGDDAAVIEPERNRLEVLSVDATERVHAEPFEAIELPVGALFGHDEEE